MTDQLLKTYDEETLDKRATSIINEAKNHNIIDISLPETFEERYKLGEELIDMAHEAREEGNQNDAVKSILSIAEFSLGSEQKTNSDVKAFLDDDEFYEQAVADVTAVPVPPDIEGDVPHKEIMRLHGAMNACSARAHWLHAREEAGKAAAKKIADEAYHDWLVRADKVDEETKKPKTIDILKSEARVESPKYREWKSKEQVHSVSEGKWAALAEIFDNHCDRLSRQWTYRHDTKG
jgi:hypothetical protein